MNGIYFVSATLIAFICDCLMSSWFSHDGFVSLTFCGKSKLEWRTLRGRQTLCTALVVLSAFSRSCDSHFHVFGILQLVVLSVNLPPPPPHPQISGNVF